MEIHNLILTWACHTLPSHSSPAHACLFFPSSLSLQGGIEVTKKARKELHNLILTWGMPPPAEGADIEAPAAAADGAEEAADAAAVLRASDYDWDGWAGRAAEVPVALRRVGDDELTVMLQVGAIFW
jgi:hypothetical protein